MTKRFKKLNLSEKAMYMKNKEYEHYKGEYEKLLMNQRQKYSFFQFYRSQALQLDTSMSDSSLDEHMEEKQIKAKRASQTKLAHSET